MSKPGFYEDQNHVPLKKISSVKIYLLKNLFSSRHRTEQWTLNLPFPYFITFLSNQIQWFLGWFIYCDETKVEHYCFRYVGGKDEVDHHRNITNHPLDEQSSSADFIAIRLAEILFIIS